MKIYKLVLLQLDHVVFIYFSVIDMPDSQNLCLVPWRKGCLWHVYLFYAILSTCCTKSIYIGELNLLTVVEYISLSQCWYFWMHADLGSDTVIIYIQNIFWAFKTEPDRAGAEGGLAFQSSLSSFLVGERVYHW